MNPIDRKSFLKLGGCCAALVALQRLASDARAAAPEAAQSAPTASLPVQSTAEPVTPAEERVKFAETWAKRFFDVFDANLDAPTREKIMKANGRACHEGSTGGRTVAPEEVDAFIARMRSHIGDEARIPWSSLP